VNVCRFVLVPCQRMRSEQVDDFDPFLETLSDSDQIIAALHMRRLPA
jgi:hypothetical protein